MDKHADRQLYIRKMCTQRWIEREVDIQINIGRDSHIEADTGM
jgi:hypothetical protein